MTRKSTMITLLAGFGSLFCMPLSAVDHCVPMTAKQRAEVETYVRKKYKIASKTTLQVKEEPAAASTCFRKIDFRSVGPLTPDVPRRLHLTLFASPDVRFLTTQLLDIKIDPEEEDRKREAAFRAGLNAGDAPVLGPAN